MKKLLVVLMLLASKAHSQPPIAFSQICVDSVWYDAVNPGVIHIAIYNGSSSSINYPVVQIIESDGDTISNVSQAISYFAHPAGFTQTYTDSITVSGITDFSNYTFVFYENIWDTSAVIGFCNVTSINENNDEQISIYPNPAEDILHINHKSKADLHVNIYKITGEVVFNCILNEYSKDIDITSLIPGVYVLKIGEDVLLKRFVKY